ncbi:hypothetical protein BKA61DRAFT_635157 [Leptodontidium sp. MPI-SDFR-AT-0119]|nr:hypothetical protein BKA61DRAFT_635157 [Leptodontidium sp. MPI-SDFR-AT-0119]
MNSLSSRYTASVNRSVSGSGPRSPAEKTLPNRPHSLSVNRPTTLRKNRVVAPPPAAYISELPGSAPLTNGLRATSSNEQRGKMLYGYDTNSDGEVTVAEGKEVTILELDVKVKASFKEGLVLTAYVEILALTLRPSSIYSNSGSSISGNKLKYVEALYEYTTRSDAEYSIAEGERFVLIKEDLSDGWAKVKKGGVVKSVPANYVKAI